MLGIGLSEEVDTATASTGQAGGRHAGIWLEFSFEVIHLLYLLSFVVWVSIENLVILVILVPTNRAGVFLQLKRLQVLDLGVGMFLT